MTIEEFKKEYFDNAFYWVYESNHMVIQKIMQELGIKCHFGDDFIKWHNGFRNLVTFKPDKFHDFEYYQKVDCWFPGASYGEAKDYNKMIEDYNKIEKQ